MARALIAFVLAAAVIGFGTDALAQAVLRVAVGPFTGQRAAATRELMAAVLQERAEVELVSEAEYDAAARRLGVEGLAGDEDLARVGRELRLDDIIVGDLSRRGRIHLLRLRVVRGSDGTTLGTASWELQRPTELGAIRGEIWGQLLPYLHVEPAPEDAAGALPPTPVPDPHAPDRASAQTPGLGVLSAGLGVGASLRQWRMPVLGELSPRGYDNTGHPELRAEVMALYRWARERAGVGAAVSLGLPLALASRATDGDGNAVELPSSALELTGSAVAVLRPPSGGWTRVLLGGFWHVFDVDTALLPREQRLARTSYTGARVAVEGVLPLAAEASYEIGLLFATELRLAVVGPELRAAFGENPDLTLGLGGLVGAQVRMDGLLPGLAMRLTGELLRYRTHFAGRADIGPGSDSVDDYLRLQLGVSYALGTTLPRQ